MSQNVKFKYLYRDGGNYKNRSALVFQNPGKLPVGLIQSELEKSFFARQYFAAHQIVLAELFFEDFPNGDDISFHEFDAVELTDDDANDRLGRTIEDFVNQVRAESLKGWDAFDPQERLFHFKKDETSHSGQASDRA